MRKAGYARPVKRRWFLRTRLTHSRKITRRVCNAFPGETNEFTHRVCNDLELEFVINEEF